MKDVNQGLVILLFIIAVIVGAAVFVAETTTPNHNKEYAAQRTAAAQACSQAGGILMFEYADGEMRFKTCTFVPGAVRQ